MQDSKAIGSMKNIPAHIPIYFQSSAYVVLALAGGMLVWAGCGKQPTPPPAATVTTTDVTTTATASQQMYKPAAAPAPTIAVAAQGGADLKQLNHVYIGWIVQNRQRPKTFEEFITLSGVQVPPAPDGKKYVIDGNGFINLVSR